MTETQTSGGTVDVNALAQALLAGLGAAQGGQDDPLISVPEWLYTAATGKTPSKIKVQTSWGYVTNQYDPLHKVKLSELDNLPILLSSKDPKSYAKLAKYLTGDPNANIRDVYSAWNTALGYAAKAGLSLNAVANNPYFKTLFAGGGATGGGPTTTIQKQIMQWTPQTAAGTINQVYQYAVGRDATDSEIKALVQRMNKLEKMNATKTTTRSIPAAGGGGNVTTTQTGGFDQAQWLKEQVQKTPGYSTYQQATTYLDAMKSALAGPVGGTL